MGELSEAGIIERDYDEWDQVYERDVLLSLLAIRQAIEELAGLLRKEG